MAKFKVGDRVRRIRGVKIDGMSVNDVGDVSVIAGDWIGIKEFPAGNGDRTPFNASNFELVDVKWVPKVGDRVRWTGDKTEFYDPAKVYEILKTGNPLGEFMLTDDYRNQHYWSRDKLISSFQQVVFKIEAGKFYKTRDGHKVGDFFECSSYWSCGKCDDSNPGHYTKDGISAYCGILPRDESRRKYDLVAEWVDEPSATNDNSAPAKFKVGDVVVDKDSDERAIVRGVSEDRIEIEWMIAGRPYGLFGNWPFDGFKLAPAQPTAIVALIENGTPKPATRPKVHTDQDSATKEAERLALLYPGQEFGVFVLAASKIADTVTETVTRSVLRAA